MEKDASPQEQPLLPSFELMERGAWYEVATENPLLSLEENQREHGMNGALVAEVLLSEEKLLHVIDFGAPGELKSIVWHPDVGEVEALGKIRERFGVLAANFVPDGRLIGFSPLFVGETVLGRNMTSASYLVGLGADRDSTKNMTTSRQHLTIHVTEDQEHIYLKDEASTNGTKIRLPVVQPE